MPKVEIENRYRSSLNGLTFSYEGTGKWENIPTVWYADIETADYPPIRHLRDLSYVSLDYPEYDMLIEEEGKPPLLFTTEHNRLLYEVESELLIPNPGRILVNIDAHNDFSLGSSGYNQRVTTGNWGAAGVAHGYWGSFVHVSSQFDGEVVPAVTQGRVIPKEGFQLEVPYYEVGLRDGIQAAKEIGRIVKGNPFIFTLDTDEFAQWESVYTQENEDNLRQLVRHILHVSGLELFNFTVSPFYCPVEGARLQWEVVREEYASLI